MAPLNINDSSFLCHEISSEPQTAPTSIRQVRSFNPPAPPQEVPIRFLLAAKNNPVEGQHRYEQTLTWRQEYAMDHVIKSAQPDFEFIKQHYVQYFHLRGRNNEPVWYEKPAAVNLKALRKGGVGIDRLLRHYAMITEFGWQYLETDDLGRSITVIDMEGIRLADFVGEVVDFTRKCSANAGDHYPERAGYVFVINVPYWFNLIWKVVKGFVDDVTLEKITIIRGARQTKAALLERIPEENIPPEYGGTSVPLGKSSEEQKLRAFMEHNNALLAADSASSNKKSRSCDGMEGSESCRFCTWTPVRSY